MRMLKSIKRWGRVAVQSSGGEVLAPSRREPLARSSMMSSKEQLRRGRLLLLSWLEDFCAGKWRKGSS